MKITKKIAFKIWEDMFGSRDYAEDFDGGLMYKYAYGDEDYFESMNGVDVYCGWNLHHILPIAHGGKNRYENLICTNIITNQEAADKITYWIGDNLYQVRKNDSGSHSIYQLQ